MCLDPKKQLQRQSQKVFGAVGYVKWMIFLDTVNLASHHVRVICPPEISSMAAIWLAGKSSIYGLLTPKLCFQNWSVIILSMFFLCIECKRTCGDLL